MTEEERKAPVQAQMMCAGCGDLAVMREWHTFYVMQQITAWRAPKEWVAVRERYYCKTCIDKFVASPTKSRGLYAQMAGRAKRPEWPG